MLTTSTSAHPQLHRHHKRSTWWTLCISSCLDFSACCRTGRTLRKPLSKQMSPLICFSYTVILHTRPSPSFSNQHQIKTSKLSTSSEWQTGSKFHSVFNHDKESALTAVVTSTVVPIGLTSDDQSTLSTVIIRPLISQQMNLVSKFELLYSITDVFTATSDQLKSILSEYKLKTYTRTQSESLL